MTRLTRSHDAQCQPLRPRHAFDVAHVPSPLILTYVGHREPSTLVSSRATARNYATYSGLIRTQECFSIPFDGVGKGLANGFSPLTFSVIENVPRPNGVSVHGRFLTRGDWIVSQVGDGYQRSELGKRGPISLLQKSRFPPVTPSMIGSPKHANGINNLECGACNTSC